MVALFSDKSSGDVGLRVRSGKAAKNGWQDSGQSIQSSSLREGRLDILSYVPSSAREKRLTGDKGGTPTPIPV